MRPIEPLVSGHGDERRLQPVQVERKHPGGLGGVDDEGYASLTAHRRNCLHGLNEAEDVGNVVADHGVSAGNDQAVKGGGNLGLSKQRRFRRRDLCA